LVFELLTRAPVMDTWERNRYNLQNGQPKNLSVGQDLLGKMPFAKSSAKMA
jgi:hypothetical protein